MFTFRRRSRREALGEGVWRRVHDRFRRGVDRYHQVLEQLPREPRKGSRDQDTLPPGTLERLDLVGRRLAALLDEVHDVCIGAQRLAPSATGDVVPAGPGGRLLDAHRALTRASGLVAQAAESATFAATRSITGSGHGDTSDPVAGTPTSRGIRGPDSAGGAERALQQAVEQVARAAALLRAAETTVTTAETTVTTAETNVVATTETNPAIADADHPASGGGNNPSMPTDTSGRY